MLFKIDFIVILCDYIEIVGFVLVVQVEFVMLCLVSLVEVVCDGV